MRTGGVATVRPAKTLAAAVKAPVPAAEGDDWEDLIREVLAIVEAARRRGPRGALPLRLSWYPRVRIATPGAPGRSRAPPRGPARATTRSARRTSDKAPDRPPPPDSWKLPTGPTPSATSTTIQPPILRLRTHNSTARRRSPAVVAAVQAKHLRRVYSGVQDDARRRPERAEDRPRLRACVEVGRPLGHSTGLNTGQLRRDLTTS